MNNTTSSTNPFANYNHAEMKAKVHISGCKIFDGEDLSKRMKKNSFLLLLYIKNLILYCFSFIISTLYFLLKLMETEKDSSKCNRKIGLNSK